jgi:hypothetical protein
MATSVSLAIDQGTSFARVLTIQDDSNVAIDVTGYTFRGQARVKYDSASPSFSFAFSIRTQTGGNVGKVDMTLAPADTSPLVIKSPTDYVYDVEMVEPGGTVRRLFEGIVTVNPEATK